MGEGHCPEATARVSEIKTWKVEKTHTFDNDGEVITWTTVYNPKNPEEVVLLDYTDGILLMVETKEHTFVDYYFYKLIKERQAQARGWQYEDYKYIMTGQYFCEIR